MAAGVHIRCETASGGPGGRDGGQEARLYEGDTLLAGLSAVGQAPLSPALEAPPPPPDAWPRLSRFALLRRDGESPVVECPLGFYRLRLYQPEAGAFLLAAAAFSPAPSPHGLPDEAAAVLLHWLRLMRALDEEGSGPDGDEADRAHWEFHDLLFHAQSRPGRRTGRVRPYRWRGVFAPLPIAKEPMGPAVFLPRPGGLAPRYAEDVLKSRRSRRAFADAPLPLDLLSTFLHHACRIRERRDDALGGVSFRPSPSAGALHGLEIYLLAERCAGVDRGLYHYDPQGHALERLNLPGGAADGEQGLDTLAEQARRMAASASTPAAYFVITARFRRYQWKYAQVAYSVMLKDVGCLHQTMSLCAEGLDLASVILGDTPAEPFQSLAGLPWLRESPVGSFSLGWPDEKTQQEEEP